jgi:hypothetical protein
MAALLPLSAASENNIAFFKLTRKAMAQGYVSICPTQLDLDLFW